MPPSERADACLAALDDAGQQIARRVFLRLVRLDDGQADARRPRPVSTLRGASGDPERLAAVLRHLAEAHLLTIDGDEASDGALVDLASDALITSWPTLGTWIHTHGKAERQRRQLEAAAAAWQQRTSQGLGDPRLYDRAELRELATWLTTDARHVLGVSEVADSFIAASHDAERRRWWPWPTSAATFLAVFLMLMLLATPIILLLIVVLIASVIHRMFG